MLLLKPFKFQNPMGKENGNRLLISLTSRSLLNTLQLGWELVVVDYSDYCDSSFLGVRYRAVLSEDRQGCGYKQVDYLASFQNSEFTKWRQVKIDQEKL